MNRTPQESKLPRRLAWRSVVFGCALLWACHSAPALAQEPFVITSPPEGAVVSPGQAVTVQWTGGDPSWLVDVYLIELTPGFPFAAVAVPASQIANSGSVADWPFPSHIDYGSFHYDTCGHTYQFYVQEVHHDWNYGPRFTVACEIPVAIDVKPDSFPNSINPKSRGSIPVAILSSATFDALTQVNQSVLTFGRTGSEASLASCHPEDVNADEVLDLVCHFSTRLTGFQPGDTMGVLRGRTAAGMSMMGTDSIRIVP